MAGAASSLKSQAENLVQVVSVFTISADQGAAVETVAREERRAANQPMANNPASQRRKTDARVLGKPEKKTLATDSAPPLAFSAKTGADDNWESYGYG